MNQIGIVYGEALYSLAAEEQLEVSILQQLKVLRESFSSQPEFLQLLASPNLSKPERCQIIDDSFLPLLEPYLLNFLKILTENNYIHLFSDCCAAYEHRYNLEHNILPVTAVTAVPLSSRQKQRLQEVLAAQTQKSIVLSNRIDQQCLGGVCLDYDEKRLDDTVAHRLEQVRRLLKNTVL